MSIHTKVPVILFLSFVFLISGCSDNCDADCEEEEVKILQPVGNYTFINNDTLQYHESLQVEIQEEIDSINLLIQVNNDAIGFFTDSLNQLNDSISNGGTSLIPIRDDIVDILLDLNDEAQQLSESSNLALESSSDNRSILNQISSGNILLSEVVNLQNELSITFEDSTSFYQLPFDMNSTTTRYRFEIDQNFYFASVGYYLEEYITERNELRLRLDSIQIISSENFDSITVNETNFTCYF